MNLDNPSTESIDSELSKSLKSDTTKSFQDSPDMIKIVKDDLSPKSLYGDVSFAGVLKSP